MGEINGIPYKSKEERRAQRKARLDRWVEERVRFPHAIYEVVMRSRRLHRDRMSPGAFKYSLVLDRTTKRRFKTLHEACDYCATLPGHIAAGHPYDMHIVARPQVGTERIYFLTNGRPAPGKPVPPLIGEQLGIVFDTTYPNGKPRS